MLEKQGMERIKSCFYYIMDETGKKFSVPSLGHGIILLKWEEMEYDVKNICEKVRGWSTKSRVTRDWFSLCFPHSHHQRETRWIQLQRLSPGSTVITHAQREEMRTSTPAAASALSSIALFPSCQFSDNVRDVFAKRSGWQVLLFKPESSATSFCELRCGAGANIAFLHYFLLTLSVSLCKCV